MEATKSFSEEKYLQIIDTPEYTNYLTFKNIQDRILTINGEIDDYIVEDIIMPILRYNLEDKNIPTNKRKRITLYLNSNGGVVDVGMNLIDIIQTSKTPVDIIVLSRAYSMGGLILLAGHTRKCYKFSSILIHDGSVGVHSSSKKAKDTMKFFEILEEKTRKFILENTKISEELFDEKYSTGTEWYITSEEALELGIVDEIIE